MDSDEEFECTQVLHNSSLENKHKASETIQVATLSINGGEFPIFNGDTKIGRDPKQCSIAINRKSVSSHHALIEVESGHHVICDLGSSNSTRVGGMLLKPHVRYNLSNGSDVQIADLQGFYYILPLKKPDSNTSVHDLFESPSCPDSKTPKRVSLDVSENSIVESTPLRKEFKEFKHPLPRSNLASLNDSIHMQTTIYGSQHDVMYEAETQIESDHGNTSKDSSVFLSETLDDSVAASDKATSSFVVPCTQDLLSESSLLLHYDTDKSMDASTSESKVCPDSKVCGKQEKANATTAEVDLFLNAEEEAALDPNRTPNYHSEYEEINCEDLVKHVEKIERSFSSESMETSKCQDVKVQPCSNEPTAAGNHQISKAQPSKPESEECANEENGAPVDTSLIDPHADLHYAETQIQAPLPEVHEKEDIHEKKTQMVHTNDTDSETDEDDLYGAFTERPQRIENIHDAKTQLPSLGNDSESNINQTEIANDHEAKTPILSTTSKSEIAKEDPYEAGTERPQDVPSAGASEEATSKEKDADNLHDAKTQVVHGQDSDSETDEEGVYGAFTEVPCGDDSVKKGSGDIHDAKTQMVAAINSDSETDEEGMYGASTERPSDSVLTSTSKDTSSKIKEPEDMHDAKTQMVAAINSDSETDEEGMYGASTERPSDSVSTSTSKDTASKIKEPEDMHDAKTQMVAAINSDSETDEEGMYGASTERPSDSVLTSTSKDTASKKKEPEDMHDAKTQMITVTNSNSETGDGGMYGASTERPHDLDSANTSKDTASKKKELEDIHDAKTQMVAAINSDSETDDEGMYGAYTEKPSDSVSTNNSNATSEKKESENIHDAKTQMVVPNNDNSEIDEEGVYGACTELPHDLDSAKVSEKAASEKKEAEDIHNAKTQMVHANESDSETDEEGVYGACTEALTNSASTNGPKGKKSEDIHDAKTQMIAATSSDSETDKDSVYGASSERPHDLVSAKASEEVASEKKESEDIHNAKTQMVHAESDSETDEEGVYGACTEAPTVSVSANGPKGKKSEDIHDAKTQMVAATSSDSETDEEGMYGASTERPHDLDSAKVSEEVASEKKEAEDIHNAKTQMVHAESDSETDEEGVYGASTERHPDHNAGEVSEKPAVGSDGNSSNANKEEANNIRTICSEEENTGTKETPADSLHDAETQMLPEPIPKSAVHMKGVDTEIIPTENVSKVSLASRGSPKKRLSLSYRKKVGDMKDNTRKSISPTKQNKEHHIANEDDISTAATQLLPGSTCTQKDEDDIFSLATQKLESPRSSRRLKSKTTDEALEESSVEPPITATSSRVKATETSTPLSRATKVMQQTLLCPGPNDTDDMFSAATQIWPSSGARSGQNVSQLKFGISEPSDVLPSPILTTKSPEKCLNLSQENDMFSAATQILPSPVSSRRTRGQNLNLSQEDDMFSAATQILPNPASSSKVRGCNSTLANESATDAKKSSPSSISTRKSPSKNLNESEIFSAATQLLPSPLPSRRKRGKHSSQENDCTPELEQPVSSNISSRNSPGENLNDESAIFSAATQVLPSPMPRRQTRGQKSSQANASTSEPVSKTLPTQKSPDKNLDEENDLFAAETQILPSPESDIISGSNRKRGAKNRNEKANTREKTALKVAGISPIVECKNPAKDSTEQVVIAGGPDANCLKLAEMETVISSNAALPSTETVVKVVFTKPSTSRRSVTFSDDLQLVSNAKSATATAATGKLRLPAQTRGKRNAKKRPSNDSQGSPRKKQQLGSSVLEVEIEDSSSDSNKSADCMIDESSPPPSKQSEDDVISDPEELPLQAETTKAKAVSKPISKDLCQDHATLAGPSNTSPIVSRSSGRRTLSLSKSKLNSQGPFKSPEGQVVKTSSNQSAEQNEASPVPKLPKNDEPDKSADVLALAVQQDQASKSSVDSNVSLPKETGGRASQQSVGTKSRKVPEPSTSVSEESSNQDKIAQLADNNVKTKASSNPHVPADTSKGTRISSRGKNAKHLSSTDLADNTDKKAELTISSEAKSAKASRPSRGSKMQKEDEPVMEATSRGASTKRKNTAKSKSVESAENSESIQPQVREDSEIQVHKPLRQSRGRQVSGGATEAPEMVTAEVPVTQRPSRARKQPTKGDESGASSSAGRNQSLRKISESSVDTVVNESQSRRKRQSKKKETNAVAEKKTLSVPTITVESPEDVPERKGRRQTRAKKVVEENKPNFVEPLPIAEESVPDTENASQTSNTSVASGRRSSRVRKQTVSLQDYDCSGESQGSQEPSSKDEASSASSSAPARGRRSKLTTKQKADPKPSLRTKGLKRLSSDVDNQEVSPQLAKQGRNLSLIMETSVKNTRVLDESAGPSSRKRENTLDDSISSDAGPESKRRRGRLDSVASMSTSPRRSPRQSFRGTASNSSVCILFSVYNNPRHESLAKQLGGSIVDTVEDADVLITDKLRRTVKLLSIVGKGLPVVSPSWLFNSKHAGRLLDPWEHLLSDLESETKFHMKLEESLKKAAALPILQDYHILVTKSVKPEPEEMRAIIQSCGGHFLPRAPSVWPANAVVISCEEDEKIWSKWKGKVPVVSAEWLLSGVIRQELETGKFNLKKT